MSESPMSESTVVGTTRKARIARLVGATAVAGLLAGGITLAATPANATVTPPGGNLPGCVLPSGVHWQLKRANYRPILNQRRLISSSWGATANGHTYNSIERAIAIPPDLAVSEGYGAYLSCSVS